MHLDRFNDLAALEKALASRTIAAFIVEPVQGKGVIIPNDGYLRDAFELCRKYGTLFVADEIQTGLGRTGRFLASEHWGIEPDMVLLAKSLSGGHVPVGAVLTHKWVFDKVFNNMTRAVVHGSTFSKNDLAMAAGLATLRVIESERLIADRRSLANDCCSHLKKCQSPRTDQIGSRQGTDDRGRIWIAALCQAQSVLELLETAHSGLFCQLIVIPLFNDHKLLTQVAGHGGHTIKLCPHSRSRMRIAIGSSSRSRPSSPVHIGPRVRYGNLEKLWRTPFEPIHDPTRARCGLTLAAGRPSSGAVIAQRTVIAVEVSFGHERRF